MLLARRVAFLRCAVLLPSLLAGRLHAQAVQTADQRLRIHLYGIVSYVRPAFQSSPCAAGIAAGGTLDGIRILPYLDLGFDLRGVTSHSDRITESSLNGGPRLSYNAYRLQPYVEYTFGVGRGTFNRSTDPDYTHDYTAVRSYGGGVDYLLTRNFSLRADAQYQRWRFTRSAPYFHPVQAGVGLSYRLHFRSRTGPQD